MTISKTLKNSFLKTAAIGILLGILAFLVFILPYIGNTTIDLEVMLAQPQDLEITYTATGTNQPATIIVPYNYPGTYIHLVFKLPTSQPTSLKINFGTAQGLALIRSATVRNGTIHFYDLKSDLLNFEHEGMSNPSWDGNSISWAINGSGARLSHPINIGGNRIVSILFLVILLLAIFWIFFRLEIKKIKLMSVVFLLLSILPLIFLGSTASLFQNRTTYEFPLLQNGNKPKHLGDPIENWFTDHMGFKAEITKAFRNSFLYNIDSTSKLVLHGKDNWLFSIANNNLDDFTRHNYFSNNQLKYIGSNFKIIRDTLAKQGIKFLFVITPNKHNIYPEIYSPKYRQPPTPSRADKLVEYLSQIGLKDNVLLIRDEIIKHKQEYPLYLKTDTHWNSYGAFFGSINLLSILKRDYGSIRIPKINQYRFDYTPNNLDTDLNAVSGISPIPEPYYYFNPTLNPVKYLILGQNQQFTTSNTDDGSSVHDPYFISTWKIDPSLKFLTAFSNNHHNPKAIVYHDSYMTWMFNYLLPAFKTVDFNWRPMKTQDLDAIQQIKPDIVIFELLERLLPYLLTIDSPDTQFPMADIHL